MTASDRTGYEQYLESEVESYRLAEERRQETAHRERQAREREYRERYAYEIRHATDWCDALNKQRILCQHEADLRDDDNAFLLNMSHACAKALEIWAVVEADQQTVINELERKIESIRERIRLEVADQLDNCGDSSEFALLAEQIRANDLVAFLDW